MRERLIKLLCSAPLGFKTFEQQYFKSTITKMADYVLADGWERPPVKIGQTVYLVEDWGYKKVFKEIEVGTIVINGVNDSCKYIWEGVYGGNIGTFADIGKTIFLTREAAEEAMRGGKQG